MLRILVPASALLCAVIVSATASSAFAQDSSQRRIDQYECKDILREPDARREVAIAFLHGYLLGKAGATAFSPQDLSKQSTAFVEHCLENPHDKALNAMMKVKG
jgi:hypothetical protein